MINNLTLAANVWHPFYTATGFAPGTDVIGCNTGGTTVFMFEGPEPAAGAPQGWPIYVGTGLRVRATTAWIMSMAPITLSGLQEYIP